VTYNATDASGNQAVQVTRTVTVSDTTAPLPTLASLPTVTGQCSATITAVPTAADDCAGTILGTTGDTLTYSAQGTFTVHWTYSDGNGNSSFQDQTVIVHDTMSPMLTGCPPPIASYECYSDVPAAATVTANDNCDGVRPVSFSETQSDPGSSCNNTITRTWTASDTHGNASTCTQVITVNDDQTPSIVCNGANPMTITLNSTYVEQGVTAGDNCTGSPTVTVAGSVNTAVVGVCTLTYTASDSCVNQAMVSRTVNVQYVPSGTCNGGATHSILPPINPDGTSIFKQGSTVPAKFRVCDALGNSIGTPGLVTSFKLVQIINGTGTTTVNEGVDSTTPDNQFRWDPTDKQWIFNISTKSLARNKTYVYMISLNDGSNITFQFGLK
jgi:hypothetical protein